MSRPARFSRLIALIVGVALAPVVEADPAAPAADNEACRPDGMYRTPGVDTPYCLAYDAAGREKMGPDHPRRLIGYFTGWRTGKDGMPAYLVSDIPWSKLTHINYAFAHIDSQNRISVGNEADPGNAATSIDWPGVKGAEIDPALRYRGHFNLLSKLKKRYPHVKTLVSVGGWAETGGYFDAAGTRVASGGYYTLTTNADNSVNVAAINAFAESVVGFLRKYDFEGVDLDYEYPTSMKDAGNPLDWALANPRRAGLMKGYVALLKTLRETLDAAAAQDHRYYLLTIAAPASAYLLRGMEAFQVTQFLDYVNIMSYDLHGAWNEFVGPNAALFDDGKDAELAHWKVYDTPQFAGIGHLNADWAYHYFRGAMQAGRINIGVPYYTRGFRNVKGGTSGLWGQAGPITVGCAKGLTSCGDGAAGIDNLWHDDEEGRPIAAGSNPLWHAKNLERGILPSYLSVYHLDPAADPGAGLTGSYVPSYDRTLVTPWLWNATKKVFISTEDEESLAAKARYVADRGIGGIMFWELAGDYAWDATRRGGQGEFFIGSTLTNLIYDRFKTASPYGNTRAPTAMPAQVLDVRLELVGFPLGDNNYPISPKLEITNNTAQPLPGGTEFQFDYPVSCPDSLVDQSGLGLKVVESGYGGPNNVGGFKGEFHRVSFKLPGWQTLAPGATIEVVLAYQLPITGPSNYRVVVGGQSYALAQDHPRRSPSGPTPGAVRPR